MSKQVVIHHSADFDGIFCREIARKFLPDAQLIGWDYGNPIPEIGAGSTLYMLDISVAGLMDWPGLIWIDHHKSAMEKFDRNIRGFRIDGVAACRLAWQWFSLRYGSGDAGGAAPVQWPIKQQFIDRAVDEPEAVRLAGEYDIWDRRDPDAELFQHGLRSQELTEASWSILLSFNGGMLVEHLLNNGRAVQFAKTQENASIITELGFTIQFEGLTFLACNHARYNSHLFTAGLKPEHDACFGFKWTGRDWSISLYHAPGREHHDLSLIAVKHGGGGHKGACGFRCEQLPFLS